jgi:hypothetical protein
LYVLLLTDRSRYLTAQQQCRMKRYLAYHAGPYGYGLQKRATHIPLATGIYIHAILADILISARELGGKPPARATIRRFIAARVAEYEHQVSLATLADIPPDQAQHVLIEQTTLVKGLVWAWVKIVLPTLLEEFDIVDVEREETLVLGCTCGAPPELGASAHVEGCAGVLHMFRPDIVLRHKLDGTLSHHDFKTASVLTESTVEEYRQSVQMGMGSLAVERRVGEAVDTYYIHALVKGQRRHDYDPDTGEYSGPKRQASVLCYLYYRVAYLPLQKADFQPKWRYRGEDGKNHSLGRNYTKIPVWEAPFEGKPDDVDNTEFWVDLLPKSVLAEMFVLIGPYPKPTQLIHQYNLALPEAEHRWNRDMWQLYQLESQHGWASTLFQDALSTVVPRSYACYSYGSKCPFYGICIERKDEAWKDPLGSGQYLPRRPHHDLELEQMLSRGIPVPDAEEAEEVA